MASIPTTNRLPAILALGGANVIWGGSTVASKAVLANIPPVTLAGLRLTVALAVLLPLVARGGGRPATGRAPALLGLTGVSLFCLCQNVGLSYTSATNAALINGGIPILTTLLAEAFLGERFGGRRVTGLVASVAGVVVIVLRRDVAEIDVSLAGDGLALASAVSFAAYAVIGRQTLARGVAGGGALAVVAGLTRYGLFFLLPVAAAELVIVGVDRLTVRDLLLVLYLGAGCSALAFILLGYGLTHLEASHGAVFGNLKPLVGVGLAVLLLGEPLATVQLMGGALILAGVVLAGSATTVRPWTWLTWIRAISARAAAHGSPADARPT